MIDLNQKEINFVFGGALTARDVVVLSVFAISVGCFSLGFEKLFIAPGLMAAFFICWSTG